MRLVTMYSNYANKFIPAEEQVCRKRVYEKIKQIVCFCESAPKKICLACFGFALRLSFERLKRLCQLEALKVSKKIEKLKTNELEEEDLGDLMSAHNHFSFLRERIPPLQASFPCSSVSTAQNCTSRASAAAGDDYP